jgi:hypothetical protein
VSRAKALSAGVIATLLATGCVPQASGDQQAVPSTTVDPGPATVVTSTAPAAATTYAPPAVDPLDADDEDYDEDSWIDG